MKLKNIEFLRFLFALIIIEYHLPVLTSVYPDNPVFAAVQHHLTYAQLAVDFFFILSVFFFAYTFQPEQKVVSFIAHKVRRLWSVVAVAIVGYLILNAWGISIYGENWVNYVYPLLFMDNIGVTFHHVGPTWYVSVFLLISVFYFGLFRSFSYQSASWITGVLTWFAYVYLLNANNGWIEGYIEVKAGFLNLGLLRGLGGMGLGILLHGAWKSLPSMNKPHPILLTAVEALTLGGLVYFMVLQTPAPQNDILFIVGFVVLIGLFLLRGGLISQALDKPFSVYLGRYAYSIYLTHILIIYALLGTLWKTQGAFVQTHPLISLASVFIAAILLGVVVYHLIENPKNKLFRQLGAVRYKLIVLAVLLFAAAGPAWIIKNRPLKNNQTYAFSRPIPQLRINGLSFFENWGRWSDGQTVTFRFHQKKTQQTVLVLQTDAFLTPERPFQKVAVWINNHPAGTWLFEYGKPLPETILPLPRKKDITIRFEIENPKSPKELGLSRDNRQVGIAFHNLTLRTQP